MRISDLSSDVCSSDLADNGERLAGQLLLEENAEHRAIGAGGARPGAIGVENADRIDRQPIDGLPVETGLLALVLGEGIGVFGLDRKIGRPSCRARVCQYV